MRRGRRKAGGQPPLVRFGVSIPRELIDQFDEVRGSRGQANRSETLRDLIRGALAEQAWALGEGRQAAVLSFVVDPQKPRVLRRALECQREMDTLLVSAFQVRLNARQELWLAVLCGSAAEVREHAQRALSLKGLSLGKLVPAGKVGG
jgi:CopG family nickel-responsive transcriptional regulator